MRYNKTAISAAICTALASSALFTSYCEAAPLVPDGTYKILINAYKATSPVGSDGNWSSTFTFGCKPASTGCGSQMMTDNATMVTYATGTASGSSFGSSVGGDGYAGTIGITVTNGTFTASSFQVDLIKSTAGGDFVQYLGTNSPSAMTGTINQSNGQMTFRPTGRLGAISLHSDLYNKFWNVNDCAAPQGNPSNTTYTQFTTGTSDSAYVQGAAVSINGTALVPELTGDVNGDGATDFTAILVTAGCVGSQWTGFAGASYFETWNIKLQSVVSALAVNDTFNAVEATPTVMTVLSNDKGAPPVTITGVTQGTVGGSVVIDSGGGSVTYTPTNPASYDDTFTYTITDGTTSYRNTPTTSTGTVTVHVVTAAVPVANPDTEVVPQNQSVALDVVSNDKDGQDPSGIPGGSVVLSTTAVPSHGKVSVNGDRTIQYAPTIGYVGPDQFDYSVFDNDGNQSNFTTVDVTVREAGLTNQGTYQPGTVATAANAVDGHVITQQLTSNGVPKDDAPGTGVTSMCVGGCYDFVVTGVSGSVQVVPPPLSTPIAISVSSPLHYRKYTVAGGWKDFDTSAGDSIASANKTAGGGCPVLGDPGWVTWTGAAPDASEAGHECLRLTILDNGLNDADSNSGSVADPSGLGAGTTPTALDPGVLNSFNSGGGGCSLSTAPVNPSQRADWWLLGAFTAWLGALKLRKHSGK